VLLFSRLAAGFFGATIGAAQAYIADVTTQKERGRGMALIGAAFGIGFTIGPAIGGSRRARATSPSRASSPSRSSPFMETDFERAARVHRGGAVALRVPARLAVAPRNRRCTASGPSGSSSTRRRLRHALATRTVPLILVLQLLGTFAFRELETTLSLLTKNKWQYDERHNGLVFTFIGFVLVLTQGGIVRRYMSRVGRRTSPSRVSSDVVGTRRRRLRGDAARALRDARRVGGRVAMVTPSLSSLLSRRTPAEHQGECARTRPVDAVACARPRPAVGQPAFGVAWTLPAQGGCDPAVRRVPAGLVLRRTPAADAESSSPPG